jgi:hypothetical protein
MGGRQCLPSPVAGVNVRVVVRNGYRRECRPVSTPSEEALECEMPIGQRVARRVLKHHINVGVRRWDERGQQRVD